MLTLIFSQLIISMVYYCVLKFADQRIDMIKSQFDDIRAVKYIFGKVER